MLSALKSEELQALINVSKTVNAHLHLDAVLESVMSVTTEVMQVKASSLFYIDEETGDLLFHIVHTDHDDQARTIKQIRLKQGEGIVGSVVESGNPLIVNDVSKDPRFCNKVDQESGFETRSILCVPLATSNKLWGAIEVINKLDGSDFDEQDQTLCEAIAGQAAIAIENSMLHQQIVKTERLTAIGQTIAGLAHCVRNVLNGIQGGAYMVDQGLGNDAMDPMLKKGWGIVKKNNAFMQELVLDMLTYSKDREPEYETCDINEIVESVCDIIKQKAVEKNVTIACTPNPSIDQIMLDPKGIRRCLLNLASNAVDACEGRDKAAVKVAIESGCDGMFQIRITDNGCGIKDEDRKKLFQMFFSTKGSKGTGLGLVVTHKIIAEHGGTIDVESKIDRGTTFSITLPMQRSAESSEQKQTQKAQV